MRFRFQAIGPENETPQVAKEYDAKNGSPLRDGTEHFSPLRDGSEHFAQLRDGSEHFSPLRDGTEHFSPLRDRRCVIAAA